MCLHAATTRTRTTLTTEEDAVLGTQDNSQFVAAATRDLQRTSCNAATKGEIYGSFRSRFPLAIWMGRESRAEIISVNILHLINNANSQAALTAVATKVCNEVRPTLLPAMR